MNKLALCCLGLMFLFACGNNPEKNEVQKEMARSADITLNTVTVHKQSADCGGEICSYVSLKIPRVESENNELAQSVNDYVSEYLQQLFKENLQEPQLLKDPNVMADKFLEGYEMFKIEFPDSRAPWFIEFEAENHYITPEYFTLVLTQTTYQGGAHPNTSSAVQSFDRVNGKKVAVSDKVDRERLKQVAEKYFRKKAGLSPSADLNESGFLFEDDKFALPENMGFVKEGILLHYNQYEAAPYSNGPIQFTVPLSEVKQEERLPA